MTNRITRFLGRTAGQRRVRFGALLAAVLLVPLAVAGLVSGAVGGSDDRLEQIPALVVNNDEMVTMPGEGGEEQPVLAGRQLVTELTGPESAGFEWKLSNDEEAAAALADGSAYAVLTIPSDFSASVVSLGGELPDQARLDIRTDDAHGYLAGSVAQSVGDAMAASLGREFTAQYLGGLYAGLAELGHGMQDAADGAGELSGGVGELAGGLDELASGAAQASSGAADAASGAVAYADGVRSYTSGVDGIAAGLGELDASAAGLDGISEGVRQYTGAVSGGAAELDAQIGPLADGLEAFVAANPEVAAQVPQLAEAVAGIAAVREGVAQFAVGGDELAAQTAAGIDGVQGGISQLAGGAAELSAGSGEVRAGADSLASGVGELADGVGALQSGAEGAAAGAHALGDGAGELASGLAEAAAQAKPFTEMDADRTADVVAEPVSVTSQRDHSVGFSEVVGVLFVPVGLWIGALALVLLFRPLGRLALASTASTGRLVGRALARTGLIALAQAVPVTLLLHLALGVSWSLLPQTAAFAMLVAVVFATLHVFLTTAFGRIGWVVSLVLVTLQLTATGGLFPLEIVAGPYQLLSPFLPLSWAVSGMQAIIAGASGGVVAGAAGVLALFGVLAAAGLGVAVSRQRGIRSLALLEPAV